MTYDNGKRILRPMARTLASCPDCGRERRIVARGLCLACYQRQRRRALGMPAKLRLDAPVTISFNLPQATLDRVRRLSEREGVTQSEWLRRAVAERAERSELPNTNAPRRRGRRG